jgi:hypothetical protein
MKRSYFAIVLFLMSYIFFTFSVNEVKASDFGWTKDSPEAVSSPDPSAATNVAPNSPEKSQVGGSINLGGGSGSLTVNENKETIVDTTLVERWEKGVPNPGPPYGWADVIGPSVFSTTLMNVIWSGADVLVQVYTNFPENGYQNPPINYLPADVFFDFEMDGTWDEGVALTDHSTIPADPSPPAPPQPPGNGQLADTFMKGNRYSATAWFSANDIHYNHSGYGGMYDEADPKIPPVWMRLGALLSAAEITWTNLGSGDPRGNYRIDVLLKGVNTSGKWNKFNVLWATANCANDVIAGKATRPSQVPTMNELGALVTGLLILASGIWISIRKKAA